MQTTRELKAHRQAWSAGLYTGTTYHDVHLAELRRTSNIDAIEAQERVFPKPPILLKESRLQMAVLEQAIGDLRQERKKTLRRCALRWITSDDTDYAFSFVTICEAFELRPDAVRKALLAGIDVEAVLAIVPEPPKPVKPKEPRWNFMRRDYCKCGCRSLGKFRGFCRAVYSLARRIARGRDPSLELLERAAACRWKQRREGVHQSRRYVRHGEGAL